MMKLLVTVFSRLLSWFKYSQQVTAKSKEQRSDCTLHEHL
jgi:hypothetical protein